MKRVTAPFFSLLIAVFVPAASHAAELASPWVAGYNSKARLIAGQAGPDGAAQKGYAGLELVLQTGWKTYWRMPGDAGGLAPTFNFEGSRNLEKAEVLYPVPMRLADPAGVSIGYKGTVVFPIRLTPLKRGEPITLALHAEYGICREICVPAEARLSLTIPPQLPAAPAALSEALGAVPTPVGGVKRPNDPSLVAARFDAAGPQRLLFEVRFPGGADNADLFVEAPEGIYLPLPQKVAEHKSVVTFALDMADGVDIAEIGGRRVLLTMVGGGRQAEAVWDVPVPPRR